MEYSKLSVKELRSIMEQKKMKGYSKCRKDELINILAKMEDMEKEEPEEIEEEIEENDILEIPNLPESIQITKIEPVQTVSNIPIPPKVYDQIEFPKDPVLLMQQFKTSLNIAPDKKMEVLKTIAQYKTDEKVRERQSIQNEIEKVRQEYKQEDNKLKEELLKTKEELKEVRESFIMSLLIIMHNFSFLPLEKIPIFKNKK
jgi:hypothetical protein